MSDRDRIEEKIIDPENTDPARETRDIGQWRTRTPKGRYYNKKHSSSDSKPVGRPVGTTKTLSDRDLKDMAKADQEQIENGTIEMFGGDEIPSRFCSGVILSKTDYAFVMKQKSAVRKQIKFINLRLDHLIRNHSKEDSKEINELAEANETLFNTLVKWQKWEAMCRATAIKITAMTFEPPKNKIKENNDNEKKENDGQSIPSVSKENEKENISNMLAKNSI